MATTTAKNYMRAEADKRLNAAIQKLAAQHGVEVPQLDIRMRDKELAHIHHTEAMAGFIESLLTVPESASNNPGPETSAAKPVGKKK